MKHINLTLSADVIEAADLLAAEMGISRNELISICLEGSTYLYGSAPKRKAL